MADPGEQVSLSSLFSVTASSSNPTYLILTGLDRDEYTAGYNTSAMGTLSGDGTTQDFENFDSDGWSVGVVFTYQASTGLYYNPIYGYFNELTFTASSDTNDNVSLSVFGTNNYGLASAYATNPYVLIENPSYFTYDGSVSVVTQPSVAGDTPSQATPDSVCSAALSFVGDAWNEDGCWVLASNISAKAGASLPLTSTLIGLAGVANGEWIVAYNGPVSANSNWESSLVAGEMVAFETTSGGGHITTVVSGSGSSAMLVDNITYVNWNGSIANPADDGSASDIIIAAPHSAMQEFSGVNPAMVVVYELDTPTVSDVVTSVTISEDSSRSLASLFTATNPVASQAITEWQVYDTNTADTIAVSGTAETSADSAANAVTVASLASVALDTGATAGTDTIEARAYNGSYWGDWQSLTATVSGATAEPPTLTDQTANQTWQQGQHVSFTLPANTFTDPQGEALTYTAMLATGQALPTWLSFNSATDTFSGTVPAGMESFTIKVTATDTSSLSASETFGITVPAAAPVVSQQTANQTWTEGRSFSLKLAADTFTEPQGETLTYTATQANGQALPTWLTFNPETETFSGTAPTTSQSVTVKVTATDTSSLSASETFGIMVSAAAPVVSQQTPNQTWTEEKSFSLTLAANTFTDPQGETLTYTATQANGQALPAWLTFNPETETFSGTAPTTAQSVAVKVTATDTSGLSASESFTATIQPPAALKPAISVTDPTANQTWDDGQAVAFVLPADTFTDALGEKMMFAAYEVYGPNVTSWLHFNPATEEFFGTVPSAETGTITLAVIATDASHAMAADFFNVSFVHGTSQTASSQTSGIGLGALVSNTAPEGLVLHPT